MIRFGLDWEGPVGLRYPRASAFTACLPMPPIEHGKGELLTDGEDILIIAYGPVVLTCLESMKILANHRVYPALVNARFAKPLDEELIRRLSTSRKLVVTVEEHALAGGFGSAVGEFLLEIGYQGSVVRLGVEDRFVEHGSRQELLEMLGLSPQAIAGRILECVNEKSKTRSHHRRWASVQDQEVL
jgi:1-deoxy-D-xylulose-5-phosphate synthase